MASLNRVMRTAKPRIDAIKLAVTSRFNLPAHSMTSHRRARCEARPRQIAMYLARELTPCSLPTIGREFGGRDHTTVMHAIETVETLCRQEDFRRTVDELRAELTR